MKAGRIQFNRGQPGPRKFLGFATSLVLAIVGFFLSQPFFWNVIVFGKSHHYLSLAELGMIVMLIIGLPMFFAGIIGVIAGGRGGASTGSYNDHDVSRIRHTVETDRMNRK